MLEDYLLPCPYLQHSLLGSARRLYSVNQSQTVIKQSNL